MQFKFLPSEGLFTGYFSLKTLWTIFFISDNSIFFARNFRDAFFTALKKKTRKNSNTFDAGNVQIYSVKIRISKSFHFVSYLKNLEWAALIVIILRNTCHRSQYVLTNVCCKKSYWVFKKSSPKVTWIPHLETMC